MVQMGRNVVAIENTAFRGKFAKFRDALAKFHKIPWLAVIGVIVELSAVQL